MTPNEFTECNSVPIHSKNIEILTQPCEFYKHLIKEIKNANRRISICSLYLGIGEMEAALVHEIRMKCIECPQIQVHLIFDYSRAQRLNSKFSSLTMLQGLLTDFPSNVKVHLHRVSQLDGWRRYLPSPLDEIVGVFHLKAYVFDNTLIMSGANLSEEYFVNRQDRYMILKDSSALAGFYHRLVNIIESHSNRVSFSKEKRCICVEERTKTSKKASLFEDIMKIRDLSFNDCILNEEEKELDTWVRPTIQIAPLKVLEDQHIVSNLLSSQSAGGQITVASGYLNFPSFFTHLLIKSSSKVNVITASPEANGFFYASGIKSALPAAYSIIEHCFYENTKATGQLSLYEYKRNRWTFHAKGMWSTPSQEILPDITIIGSSNFGRRSYERDFESQLVIFTKSPSLRVKLREEYTHLMECCEEVDDRLWKRKDRQLRGFGWKLGYWIKPVTRIISAFL